MQRTEVVDTSVAPRHAGSGQADERACSEAELVRHIVDAVTTLRRCQPERVVIVGIDGPTASGKSTLSVAVAAALTEAGTRTATFQLDWALRARLEREADVAHLRRIDAAFEYEGELHMRLELAGETFRDVARFNLHAARGITTTRTLPLTGLYSRAAGGTTTGEDTLELHPGLVLLVEGHYTLRTELDALIDFNIVLLSDVDELLARKINRVKGYRNGDDAAHYFWHTDLPSFGHHVERFGRNADLIVDNTDYRRPRVVRADALARWIEAGRQAPVGTPRRLTGLADVPTFVFSGSQLVPAELLEILGAAVDTVVDWDKLVGHYLRVAIDEVEQDLEARARAAVDALNGSFDLSPYRVRLSHTDALYRVYHRKLPLTLGLEIYDRQSGRPRVAVLADVESDRLQIAIYWEGGATRFAMTRTLGGIRLSEVGVEPRPPMRGTASAADTLNVFLPTEFTVPAFLDGIDHAPVFLGREQENVSASKILEKVLGNGGVWIHRFSLHREIRFFQYCLAVEGVPSVHVGNYLIAVNTTDPRLRQRFRAFREEWASSVDGDAAAREGHDAYDAIVEREHEAVREYVATHATHLTIRDGAIFGNVFAQTAIDEVLAELARLLTSPHRLLRRRVVDFLDQQFPGLAMPADELWDDLPPGAERTITLAELTSLSSSIIAEIYLWLALRNQSSAVLGANVYDIRRSSLDARAFLEAAAERGCPIVLQCSLNAIGHEETIDGRTFRGYLRPRRGVADFTEAARTAARDLYLLTGKRPPLYGIGLDHVNSPDGAPAWRAKRFLHESLRAGGVTHVVLDGSHLFQLTGTGRDELTVVYRQISEWVLDLMDAPGDTFLKDMELCISELNYVGGGDAYVPDTEDIRLFCEAYGNVLIERGYAAHAARPKLFIGNLGTRHHGSDEVTPWVERSREWRDAVKRDGFVSAVLHGTSRSHPETLSAATVGCHKVNVAGDFLDTLINNLPLPLSRTIQEGGDAPKAMLAAIRADMDLLSDGECTKLHEALREHASRILKTVNSPQLSSMDANYFQYKDYDLSAMQVTGILAAVRHELAQMLPQTPRFKSDRQVCAFAASMIEVPDDQFRGPVLKAMWEEGIRHFHIDAGDGTFIPRRFSGVDKVRYLRRHFPDAIIHTHLMVVNPHYPKDGEFAEIQQYAEAGTNAIAFHPRACASYQETVSAIKIIRRLGVRPGIVIETSDTVDEHLEKLIRDVALDWVVVMGVPIGYGGQLFQYSTLKRISRLHDLASRVGRDLLVECDGGLTLQNLELCRDAGGQLFSGWSIIKSAELEDIKRKVRAVNGVLRDDMSRPVNVVIPMAGRGKRFRRAGYETYKPFLPIFGKPMIQYVLESFPAHLPKFVVADRDLLTGDQVAYLEAQPGVVLVFVPSHEEGPAYSVLSARGQLPLDESFFVAYCDIFWTWDYAAVERLLDHDGIVFTRRQFHPHLVGNNYSAFCRPAADDPDRLLEIREKSSFTDAWMSEPLSIGAFYAKNGHAMIAAIEPLVSADDRVSGEFFPSLLFNALVAAGADVRLSDVDFFVHWGVPAQLEDVRQWVAVCRRLAGPSLTGRTAALNVCCMGGAGVRLQHLTTTPKALMPMESGEPMFRYVAARFGADNNCFIVNRHMAPRLQAVGVSTAAIIDVGEPTTSQLETLQRAAPFLQRQEQFLLTSCDAFGLWDSSAFAAFLARVQPDAVVFTFGPTLLQQTLGGGHTYVQVRDGSVISVHIKHRPDDNAAGLAGFFWFSSGSVFGDLGDIVRDTGHEPCADHILKHMVERGDKVAAYPLDAYLHLGSPAELDEFAFWHRYYRVFEPSPPRSIPPVSEYIAS